MTPSSSSLLRFSLIVAVDSQFGIGKSGGLPWHLSADLKHFKTITTQMHPSGKLNVVIMGRKTWDSLPQSFQPLPGRINLVITRQADKVFPSGVIKAAGLNEALELLATKSHEVGDVFVIGGAQIFQEAIGHPSCQKLYLTRIEAVFNCDTFFPQDLKAFHEIDRQGPFVDNKTRFFYCELERSK